MGTRRSTRDFGKIEFEGLETRIVFDASIEGADDQDLAAESVAHQSTDGGVARHWDDRADSMDPRDHVGEEMVTLGSNTVAGDFVTSFSQWEQAQPEGSIGDDGGSSYYFKGDDSGNVESMVEADVDVASGSVVVTGYDAALNRTDSLEIEVDQDGRLSVTRFGDDYLMNDQFEADAGEEGQGEEKEEDQSGSRQEGVRSEADVLKEVGDASDQDLYEKLDHNSEEDVFEEVGKSGDAQAQENLEDASEQKQYDEDGREKEEGRAESKVEAYARVGGATPDDTGPSSPVGHDSGQNGFDALDEFAGDDSDSHTSDPDDQEGEEFDKPGITETSPYEPHGPSDSGRPEFIAAAYDQPDDYHGVAPGDHQHIPQFEAGDSEPADYRYGAGIADDGRSATDYDGSKYDDAFEADAATDQPDDRADFADDSTSSGEPFVTHQVEPEGGEYFAFDPSQHFGYGDDRETAHMDSHPAGDNYLSVSSFDRSRTIINEALYDGEGALVEKRVFDTQGNFHHAESYAYHENGSERMITISIDKPVYSEEYDAEGSLVSRTASVVEGGLEWMTVTDSDGNLLSKTRAS
ncbi:MAG: hypothetical protein V2B18_04720 [Pseudomonadota bacterium]